MYLLCHLISSFHCLQRITKMLVFLSANNIYLFYYLFPKFLNFFSLDYLDTSRCSNIFNKGIKIRALFYVSHGREILRKSLHVVQRSCNFLIIPSLSATITEINREINRSTFFSLSLSDHAPETIDQQLYDIDLLNSSSDKSTPRLQIWYTHTHTHIHVGRISFITL